MWNEFTESCQWKSSDSSPLPHVDRLIQLRMVTQLAGSDVSICGRSCPFTDLSDGVVSDVGEEELVFTSGSDQDDAW